MRGIKRQEINLEKIVNKYFGESIGGETKLTLSFNELRELIGIIQSANEKTKKYI